MERKDRKPGAFMSYAHADDDDGRLSEFRKKLSAQTRKVIGVEFPIFQDCEDIKWGEEWESRIDESLAEVTFFIPIITPSFFKSKYCRDELIRFLEREERLGLKLILPVYYIETPLIKDESKRSCDELAQKISSRQYVDCRELQFEDLESKEIRRLIINLAMQIRDTLESLPQEKMAPMAAERDQYQFYNIVRSASANYGTVPSKSDNYETVTGTFEEFINELKQALNISNWIIFTESLWRIAFIARKVQGYPRQALFIGVTNGDTYNNKAELKHVFDQFCTCVEKDHMDITISSFSGFLILVFADISRTSLYSQCKGLERKSFWKRSDIYIGFYDSSSGKLYADKNSRKFVFNDTPLQDSILESK